MRKFLEIKNLSYNYAKPSTQKSLIKSLAFGVKKATTVSLVGLSGCGKTTILQLIAGVLKPEGGSITVKNSSIYQAREKGYVNYVPQQTSLLPHLTVRENVLLPTKVAGSKVRKSYLNELVTKMSLADIVNYYPYQLSGGMSQRVATARSLITKPTLLLMDEPFASIDQFSREDINEDLLSWQDKQKTTILFVTHNIEEAVFLSHRILVIKQPGAKIAADIKIDVQKKDNSFRFTKRYHRYVNRVRKYILQ